MISPLPARILIPIHKSLLLFYLLVAITATPSISSSPAKNPVAENLVNRQETMRVHPLLNVTIHYKKLRRLPHVFSRVLELPFRSDADVSVEEFPDFFRFVAMADDMGEDVRAHTVEIHPGVTKIVVRGGGFEGLSLDELELDVWRFRLPESTRPELASAVCVDGELVVTVPKGGDEADDGGVERDIWGNNRLVLVQ